MKIVRMLAWTALCPLAGAQLSQGDIVLATSSINPGLSTLLHLDSNGTQIGQTTLGTGSAWIGAAPTSTGRIAVGRQFAEGVNVFDASTMTEVVSWDTGGGWPADVECFPDGTLAVADQNGAVLLFDEAGNPLGAITYVLLATPIGLGLDRDGDLWVSSLAGPVFEFDTAGALLSSFDPGFFTPDVVPAPDGSLWILDTLASTVHHVTDSGAPISNFPTVAVSNFIMGLARGTDGTLWVSSHHAPKLFHYSAAGTLLGSVLLGATGLPVFLRVVADYVGSGTAICFGDGTGTSCPCFNEGSTGQGCANGTGAGGVLSASGTPSVTADSLSLTADGVINNSGLFFQGDNTIGGGTGAAFGDGIRCCGGGVVRIQVVNPPGSASPGTAIMTETATTNGPGGTITAGTKRCYQYWYRDPATSPCGNQFNLTNAVSVTWQP